MLKHLFYRFVRPRDPDYLFLDWVHALERLTIRYERRGISRVRLINELRNHATHLEQSLNAHQP